MDSVSFGSTEKPYDSDMTHSYRLTEDWLIRYPVLCLYLKVGLGVKGRYGAHTGDANRGGRLGPHSNNEE